MQYRTLGKTGMNASVVAFGGIVVQDAAPEQASASVARAIEHGVNYFDVATFYGDAQYKLGPALAPYRKDVYLACKTVKRTAKEAQAELEESLKALETDYFDVYQMHALDNPEELKQVFGPGGAMEAFVAAKKQGKIRNIGFSCHRERTALYLMDQFDFDTVMHPINFLCMERNGKGELLIEMAHQKNIGIIALKTLALRPYYEGESSLYANNWYCPITDDEYLCELAMRVTANAGNLIMVSPGIPSYLDLMIKIIEENPNLPPLTSSEVKIVQEKTKGLPPIFAD
jgi:predicted aldo/keto reductase-like oxidoreductase